MIQLLLTFYTILCPTLAEPAPHSRQDNSWPSFLEAAERLHGSAGTEAALFLIKHRPAGDQTIAPELLLENLELALRARKEFPWSKSLPDSVFHNNVLPYAVLDERRERWRPEMYALARELVADCHTASEAAQALNRKLFDSIGVHYSTGRKRANQSPSESMDSGRASCTGLSILLVDACRSVGIPARVAGVAQWNGKQGNHTWVEVWDGSWHFTGADEYDAKGLDRSWFQTDAKRALAGIELHAVWASSWRKTGARFPMAWNMDSHAVSGIDVSARYAPKEVPTIATVVRHVRAWSRKGGKRLALEVELLKADGLLVRRVSTRAGTQDLNDMPELALVPGAQYSLRVRHGAELRSTRLKAEYAGEATLELYWSELDLTEASAQRLIEQLWVERAAELEFRRFDEMEAEAFVIGKQTLRFKERTFGEPPLDGHSLWISMHGGGGAPSAVNDGQWRNQIGLYALEEGIYVAPRAPTDTWDLWHQGNIDPLFARLIDSFVAMRGVDPNRVYLLGYSAGGDGVYQLAPRMADRFAAACMMAGHPNEAQPLGLRNLPLGLFVGGQDAAYDRNKVAAAWNHKLDVLRAADPEGYEHRFDSYPECGHWMDGQDAEGLPWMASKRRNCWPQQVVWYQDDVLHQSAYWLQALPGEAAKGQLVRARVEGQRIHLESEQVRGLVLRLHDRLIDLDQEIEVLVGERVIFSGRVPRTEMAIRASIEARCDRNWAASASLLVRW